MIKMLSLFSGIGAFEKALSNQNIPFELVNYCEFDKYASKSYSLIHGEPETKNLGDITKVDIKSLPQVDLITYGFPCQDISLAGKQKGLFNEDGSRTRSGLFFNALDIIKHCRPKVAIAENVKNLTSKKFSEQFKIVLESLDEAGYNNYWKILNSKDYGIPQNRERVFIVSIRKDVDTGVFKFHEPYELTLRLKDVLETDVDEKYFINTDKTFNETPEIKDEVVRLGNIYDDRFGTGYAGNVWDKNGICPTLMTMQGGGRQPHIITPILGKTEDGFVVRNANKQGYDIAKNGDSIGFTQASSTTRRCRVGHGVCHTLDTGSSKHVVVDEPFIVASRGRNPENPSDRSKGCQTVQRLEPNTQGICNTLTTVQKDNYVCLPSLRIRKLTPKECFRLQGFDDKDVDICSKNGISNTQLYKQAGNSITVDVVEELFCMLFDERGDFYL